jgi:hypothetical protein
MEGVQPRLRSALEELGTDARLWLSNKLGVTPDSNLIKKAGLERWEEITARQAQRYLTSGKADKALELMRERTERSAMSPLYRLELETLRVLGLYEEAAFVADNALAAAGGTATAEFISVLLLQASLIKEGQGNIEEAILYIKETEKLLADPPTDILETLRIYVTHVRLLRKKGATEDTERGLLLQQLISLIAKKGSDDITIDDIVNKRKVMFVEPSILSSLRSNPALLQELVAESGKLIPELLDNAIDWIGIDVQNDQQKGLLADALKNWNTELRSKSRRDLGELVERAGVNEDNQLGWLKYVNDNTNKMLTRNIQHWRKEISVNNSKNETTVNFDKALVDIYRHNVDMSINKNFSVP